MPALFPNSIRVYSSKADLVDTVLAEHVNLLQDEVTAIENTLGTGILSSSWSGTFSTPSSHASAGARLANIEAGLASLDSLKAPKASPSFTGTPTAPTATPGTNTTQVATTAFVKAAVDTVTPGTGSITSTMILDGTIVNGDISASAAIAYSKLSLTGSIVDADVSSSAAISQSKISGLSSSFSAKANLASPSFSGTPTAPTAGVDTNTTQIATTQFVLAQAASTTPLMDGTAAVGSSTRYARADHVHASDTSRAPLVSPTFTGTPTAPTATPDTSTTQIATTAFVVGQASNSGPASLGATAAGTSTRFARSDHVHALPSAEQVGAIPTTLVTAKGDLIARGASAPERLSAGANGQFLQADSSVPLGLKWVDVPLPDLSAYATLASPTFTGSVNVPTPVSATNAATKAYVDEAVIQTQPITQTGNYTLLSTDVAKTLYMNNSSAATVTLPSDSVSFPVNGKIDIIRIGDGEVTLQEASGVVLESESGKKRLNGKFTAVSAIKRASNRWIVIGALKT